MEDVKQYLSTGTSISTFRAETGRLLSRTRKRIEGESCLKFPRFVQLIFSKTEYLDAHPVYNFSKASRLFAPKMLPCISHDIDSFIKKKMNSNDTQLPKIHGCKNLSFASFLCLIK